MCELRWCERAKEANEDPGNTSHAKWETSWQALNKVRRRHLNNASVISGYRAYRAYGEVQCMRQIPPVFLLLHGLHTVIPQCLGTARSLQTQRTVICIVLRSGIQCVRPEGTSCHHAQRQALVTQVHLMTWTSTFLGLYRVNVVPCRLSSARTTSAMFT
jgi:hypothetical protein